MLVEPETYMVVMDRLIALRLVPLPVGVLEVTVTVVLAVTAVLAEVEVEVNNVDVEDGFAAEVPLLLPVTFASVAAVLLELADVDVVILIAAENVPEPFVVVVLTVLLVETVIVVKLLGGLSV